MTAKDEENPKARGVKAPAPFSVVPVRKETPTEALSRKFSANLKMLREARGMNKSGLAKALWGTEVDNRGYTVAHNRDRVGAWESERARPTPENLTMLASFFGVEVSALAPDLAARNASSAPEAMSMRILESDPTRAHVQINTLLPIAVAVEIMRLASTANHGDAAGGVPA